MADPKTPKTPTTDAAKAGHTPGGPHPTQYPVDPKNTNWKPRKVGQFDMKKAEAAAKPPEKAVAPAPKTKTVYGYRDPRPDHPVHARPTPPPAPEVIVLTNPTTPTTPAATTPPATK